MSVLSENFDFLIKKYNSFNLMEKEKKKAYEEPRVELFGIMAEGVICGSVPPGGSEDVEDEGDLPQN